ncbi:hypothetical protein DFP73DRAFT_620676 [Morchella snyderi]|nr:hypothetical protein DFP73DRAFT_620676 [Morchella snyderi]
MFSLFKTYLAPAFAQDQKAKPLPKRPICWRIGGIPLEWSRDDLVKHLQAFDESLQKLEEHWLSLFPAYSGNTQTALLNLELPLQYFQNLNSDETTAITIRHLSKEGEQIEVDLSIDCHFHGLTPVNTPTGDNIIDVVAVTGFSGHAYGSWKNRQSHRMWLKDFLPRDLPKNVRILTYGYNSSLLQEGRRGLLEFRRTFVKNLSTARNSLEERARPLVMLGHSLGCILITQALLQAQSNPDDKHILDATSAVFFFGAPHAGLKVDALVAMVEDLTSSNKQSTRLRLLEQLREDSEYLEEQRERLIHIWSKMRIYSFYELKDTPTVQKAASGDWKREGEAVLMIRNISALLFLPQENRYAINEDNTNMVRFGTRDDENYKVVVRHIKECLDQYLALRSQRDLEQMRHRSEKLNEFLRTLEAFSCQHFRDDLFDKRHARTCRWFFDCEEYKDGKSVLLSYVTKQLANHRRAALVAYFFCDDKREEQNTAISILRSLIYQILSQAPSLYQYIPREYLPDSESKFTWGFGSLWQVFECLVKNKDGLEIFCVVDALDECEEETRDKFLENLRKLFEGPVFDIANHNFKMITTSRPELPSTRDLPVLTTILLEDRNKNDILQYINDHVSRLAKRKKLPGNLENDIQRALLDGAGGMFLWVSLTLYRLEKSPGTSASSIRAQLKELPKDIPAIYASILEEIDFALREQAKRILEWVNLSKRPLSVEELKIVIALKVQREHTSIAIMQEHVENNLDHFFGSLFGPLLKIERDTVRFVHQSVKDFLGNLELMRRFDSPEGAVSVRNGVTASEQYPVSAFHSTYKDANLHLAIDCLTFLSSEEFEMRESQDALEYHSRLSGYPFLEYAATRWPEHVNETDRRGDQELVEAFLRLAHSDSKMNSAYQIYHEYEEHGKSSVSRMPQFQQTPPLQICASLGFTEFVKALVKDGASINDQGGVHGSALMAAIWSRSEAVIKLLLNEENKNINTSETMLAEVSAWCKTTEPMELLLSRGVKVPEAAMIAAAKNWHGPEALRCLLAVGGQPTELVLSTAVTYYQRKEPLDLLLDEGGKITQAVLLAAIEGWKPDETIKTLLSRGEVEITEAMIVAIVGKGAVNTELLELMLSKNNTIQITNEIMATSARTSKDRDVLKFLLSKGGKVTEGVLVAAAENHNGPQTLKFLLSKDREMQMTESMLLAATRNTHAKKYMDLLLHRGAKITEAVMIAAAGSWSGSKELLEMLLEKGGQVTGAVLLAAARNRDGFEALEFLLISRGTKVIMSETMMLDAVDGPSAQQTMELLLSVGGQVSKAVMVTATRGQYASKELLQLLLDNGGEVTEEVMIEAASNRWGNFDTDVLDLLIGRGGQVTKRVIEAAGWSSSKKFVEHLLSIDGTITIAEEMLVEAARHTEGLEVLKFLLTQPDHKIPITEAMLVAAAKNKHATKYLALLLKKGGESMITENVLVAAAGNWSGKGALEFLLSVDDTVLITEPVLVAAAGNSNGRQLLESIFVMEEHKVTEAMLLAAAGNMSDSGALEYLLNLDNTLPITEPIMVAAVRHGHGGEFVRSLLSRGGQVTEKVLVTAAGNWENGKEYLETLLTSNNNSSSLVTEAVLVVAAGDTTGRDALQYLLDIGSITLTNPVTEALMVAAANNGDGDAYLELLINQGGQVTEAVMLAAAGSWKDEKALEFLLKQKLDFPITTEMLLAAAKNTQTGKRGLELLWSADNTVPVTEELLEVAAKTSHEVFTFVFNRARNIQITEKMLMEAAVSWRGREILDLMFSTVESMPPITENVIAAAAGNSGFSNPPLEFLFNQADKPPLITEKILITAANNIHGDRSLKFLYSDHGEIIPPTEAILVSAAWNPKGSQNLEFLLEKGGEINETLMLAAALNPGESTPTSLDFLLDRGGIITERVMLAAAWNPSNKKTVNLNALLVRGGQITEQVMMGAAMNPGGKHNLEILLSRGGRLTDAVFKARDESPTREEAIDFLLRSIDQTSRKILLRAARGRAKGGPELFELYYEVEGGSIAAKILEAAVENETIESYAPPSRAQTASEYVDAVSEIFFTQVKRKSTARDPPIELIADRLKVGRLYDIIFYLMKLTDILIFCLLIYGLSSAFIVQTAAMTRFDFINLLDSYSTWARKVRTMDIPDVKEKLATLTRLCGGTLNF